MSDPNQNPLKRQLSKTSLEQSLKMITSPQQAPITIYPGPSAGLSSLSKEDLEIAQRLQNLRKSHQETLPTEEEMASRLAQLKGLPTDHYTRSASNSTAAAYQQPDRRTQGERADELLSQVMEEVSIDSRAPKPDDELEARLARLRGEESRPSQAQGAIARPPAAFQPQSQARADAALGEDLDDMSMDEVEALMQAAAQEAHSSADKAVADLQADPELAQAVAQATRKKEKKRRQKKSKGASGEGDTSDEERRSKSFDSDIEIEGGKAIDAVTEQEEVQRIIDMYTKRAQLKREKKQKKKEAAAAAMGGAVGGEDTDSDIDLSSESDSSSESEKFSDSDEFSD